jgi:hypothetical protein
LFAKELAIKHPELTVIAVHPGRISTGLGQALAKESRLVRLAGPLESIICVPIAEGVKNHVWAATAEVVSGKYYEPVGVPDRESKLARDSMLSTKLWEWTEAELRDVV